MDVRTKRTIKYLAVCKDNEIVSHLLQKLSLPELKSICNSAFNATSGQITITQHYKRIFDKHRYSFSVLTSKSLALRDKCYYLKTNKNQVHSLIQPLLECTLVELGSSFIIGHGNIQKANADQQVRLGSAKGKENQSV